jgi:hypothetical protein
LRKKLSLLIILFIGVLCAPGDGSVQARHITVDDVNKSFRNESARKYLEAQGVTPEEICKTLHGMNFDSMCISARSERVSIGTKATKEVKVQEIKDGVVVCRIHTLETESEQTGTRVVPSWNIFIPPQFQWLFDGQQRAKEANEAVEIIKTATPDEACKLYSQTHSRLSFASVMLGLILTHHENLKYLSWIEKDDVYCAVLLGGAIDDLQTRLRECKELISNFTDAAAPTVYNYSFANVVIGKEEHPVKQNVTEALLTNMPARKMRVINALRTAPHKALITRKGDTIHLFLALSTLPDESLDLLGSLAGFNAEIGKTETKFMTDHNLFAYILSGDSYKIAATTLQRLFAKNALMAERFARLQQIGKDEYLRMTAGCDLSESMREYLNTKPTPTQPTSPRGKQVGFKS